MQKLRKKIESATKWMKNPGVFLALILSVFFVMFGENAEAAATISKLEVNPSNVLIGTNVTLSWEIQNLEEDRKCLLNSTLWEGTKDITSPTGNMSIKADKSAIITLGCGSDSKSVSLTATQLSVDLTATPLEIKSPGDANVALRWTISPAAAAPTTSCTLKSVTRGGDVGGSNNTRTGLYNDVISMSSANLGKHTYEVRCFLTEGPLPKKILATDTVTINEQMAPAVSEGACDLAWDKLTAPCIVFNASYVISYLLGTIAGVIVTLETWALQIVIGISSGIASSAVVTAGFGPALSIANLGFVIAIIVIALATILRSQSYGIKQIFWKLIIAAILVNFSLTIAAEIANFGDNFGNYFLNQIGGNVDGGFAAKITTAFQPQQAASNIGNNPAVDEHLTAALAGKTLGGILTAIASLATSLFTLLIIIITLGALLIMLIIRYVYLGFLMILMPLAWLAWIFPNLNSWWSKWWSNFFRWVFFYPLVLFFLNLMVTVATTTRGLIGSFQTPTGPYGALTVILGQALSGPLTALMQSAILAGLGIGGLMAANSLSITGAKGGMAALQGAGQWIASGTGRLAGRAAARPMRGEWGRKASDWAQRQGAGMGVIGRALTSPIRGIGRLAEKGAATTGEKDIEARKKELSGLTKNERFNKAISATMMRDRVAAISTFTPQEHAEFNEELKKRKLDSNKFYGHETKAAFEQFGQGKLYKDGRQASGKEFEDILNGSNEKQQSARGISKLKEREKALIEQKDSGAITADGTKELNDVQGKISQIQKDYPDDLNRYLQKVSGAGEHAANYFKSTDNEEHKKKIAEAVAGGSQTNLVAFAKQIENSGKLNDFATAVTKNNIKFSPENEKLVKKGGAGLDAVGFSPEKFNLKSEEEEKEARETAEKKTKSEKEEKEKQERATSRKSEEEEKEARETAEKKTKSEKEEKEKQERATSRTQEVETSLKDMEESLSKARENFEKLTQEVNRLSNEIPKAEEAMKKAEEGLREAEVKLNTPQIIVEGRSGEEIRAEREKERAAAQTQRQIALDTLNKAKTSHETVKIQQQEAVRTVETLKVKRDQAQREAERAKTTIPKPTEPAPVSPTPQSAAPSGRTPTPPPPKSPYQPE